MVLTGPFLAAALLLVLGGAVKTVDPLPLVRALRSVGLRLPAALVRAGAVGEVLVGVSALLTGSRAAAVLVALSYAAFTVFVVVALRRGGVVSSCGCFGRADTPPTRSHAVLTAGLAAAAAAVAVRPAGALPGVLAASPAGGLPLLLATAALAAVVYVALAVLPLLAAARRPVTAGSALR